MAKGLVRQRNRTGAYFTLPISLFLIAFILFPLFTNLRLSLIDRGGEFAGLTQYGKVFASPSFWKSLRITITYVVGSVSLQLVIGTAVGIALNERFPGRAVMRSIVLIPWVIPGAVGATTWAWMYHGDLGIISRLLTLIGFTTAGHGLLIQPNTVLPALIAVNVWKMFPFVAVMVLAGLQSIDENLYEAARVDGANRLQETIHITLPGLRHVLVTVLLLLTIWGFNAITLVYTMTQGGPADLSLILPLLIYRSGFIFFQFNQAAAQSVFMFVLLAVLIAVYLWVFTAGRAEEQ